MRLISKCISLVCCITFSSSYALHSCHGIMTTDCRNLSSWAKNPKAETNCKAHYQMDKSGWGTGSQCYVGPGLVKGFNCLPSMSSFCLVMGQSKNAAPANNKK